MCSWRQTSPELGQALRKVSDIARIAGLTALLTALPLAAAPVLAQSGGAANPMAKKLEGKPGDKLLVEADELIYDNDNNTVTARGNAELHYGPRTLQADRVRYDRGTSRVFAEGNVRLTDKDGAVVTGERMELTDDFKTGFIDSLRIQQSVERRGETVRTLAGGLLVDDLHRHDLAHLRVAPLHAHAVVGGGHQCHFLRQHGQGQRKGGNGQRDAQAGLTHGLGHDGIHGGGSMRNLS